MLIWAHRSGVARRLSDSGKPTQNAYIESFSERFRAECLNDQWFTRPLHAKAVIRTRPRKYHEERPKKVLGGLTPAAYAR